VFAGLVVYASLYPFAGWRWPGGSLWEFVGAPWPRYWTGFDLVSNLLGYGPLGFLLALGMMRSGWGGWSWWGAVLGSSVLSLSVEAVQNLLPMRVPSNVDWGLNSVGAMIGAGVAWGLQRLGVLQRWSQFRADWFTPQAHGGLVLLALWPFALLYPVSVPFGLGQVFDRLQAVLARALSDTPFLSWLPMVGDRVVPLSPLTEAFCIALGLLAPLFMGYADLRSPARRGVFLLMLFACALGASGLSSALTYGPLHAWSWLHPQVGVGMGVALLLGLLLLALPARWCHVGLVLCLAVSLSLLNRASASPYFAQSLELWEQGRFIRFHGLSQWLGWLWPFAALVFGVRALAQPLGRAD
jgi:VanZ family protein